MGKDEEFFSALVYEPKNEQRPSTDLRAVFHRCWTNAVASPDYKKGEWQDLCVQLRRLGIEMQ